MWVWSQCSLRCVIRGVDMRGQSSYMNHGFLKCKKHMTRIGHGSPPEAAKGPSAESRTFLPPRPLPATQTSFPASWPLLLHSPPAASRPPLQTPGLLFSTPFQSQFAMYLIQLSTDRELKITCIKNWVPITSSCLPKARLGCLNFCQAAPRLPAGTVKSGSCQKRSM